MTADNVALREETKMGRMCWRAAEALQVGHLRDCRSHLLAGYGGPGKDAIIEQSVEEYAERTVQARILKSTLIVIFLHRCTY